METYMMLFRGGRSENGEMSNEEMQAHMGEWMTWIGQLRQAGVYVSGEPLNPTVGRVLTGAGGSHVKEGPYSEAHEAIGGYVAITAASLDEATDLARGCPTYSVGGAVELRLIQKM